MFGGEAFAEAYFADGGGLSTPSIPGFVSGYTIATAAAEGGEQIPWRADTGTSSLTAADGRDSAEAVATIRTMAPSAAEIADEGSGT